MLCPICSKEIKDSSKFCTQCGKKIPRCPACGTVIQKRMRFCINDGTPLPKELLRDLPDESSDRSVMRQVAAVVEKSITTPENGRPVTEIKQPVKPVSAHESQRSAAREEAMDKPSTGQKVEGRPEERKQERRTEAKPDSKVPVPEISFCTQCGKLCEPGQLLCSECRQKSTAAGEMQKTKWYRPEELEGRPKEKKTVRRTAPGADFETPAPESCFCTQCGKPCEPGQLLCSACQQANMPANEVKRTRRERSGKKEGSHVPVLKILIVVLSILAVAVLCVNVFLFFNGRTQGNQEENGSAVSQEDSAEETGQANKAPEASQLAESQGEEESEPQDVPTDLTGQDAGNQQKPADEPAEKPAEEHEQTKTEEPKETRIEHTYEIIADDVTWQEAKQACIARGGHLATITSLEEYKKITELADRYTLNYLWLGGILQSEEDEWGDGSWITGEEWTYDNWYPGEPSKTDADGTQEFCLCMWNAKYDEQEIGWTFNDQRNDIVGAFPSVAGRIGYICEFETEVAE